MFIETVSRDVEGRYTARIPFEKSDRRVTETRKLASSRLHQMEHRFERNSVLKSNYQKFMAEYEALGHMELVPPQELRNSNAVHIPHHAADTRKFRVVFDGSAKVKNGVSINDIQLNGEKLQPELTTIIMQFRSKKIALCADIAKMYRQIRVPKDQQDYQRILWRDSAKQPIREYRLTTQTYGMKAAAYMCIRTLVQCAKDYAAEYPKESKIVLNCFYVDDYMGGADTIEEAIGINVRLTEMLGCGGFPLVKWVTNSIEVHRAINGSDNNCVELDKEATNAVLGLTWNPSKDSFQYKIKNPPTEAFPTKRSIVSDIARLYDPNGFLAPVVVKAKIIIQHLWRTKLGWDDKVVENQEFGHDIATNWLDFRRELIDIEKIATPRWIGTTTGTKNQLHGFADASQQAYGVAYYIRSEGENGNATAHLVFAKARVAPITKATIPKLELCATHLLAKLLKSIREAHNVGAGDCYLWTDSMIALHWIAKSPAKLETFQANRVAEIQELTENVKWQHVVTKDNPADLVSRGVGPSKLNNNQMWWNGPNWLIQKQIDWPKSNLTNFITGIGSRQCRGSWQCINSYSGQH